MSEMKFPLKTTCSSGLKSVLGEGKKNAKIPLLHFRSSIKTNVPVHIEGRKWEAQGNSGTSR